MINENIDYPLDSTVSDQAGLAELLDKEQVEAAKLKLASDAVDVNQTNFLNETPLVIAIRKGYIDVAKILMSKPRIDLHVQSYLTGTALTTAIFYERDDLIDDLLRLDAKLDGGFDKTHPGALLVAVRRQSKKLVEKLLYAGADIDSYGDDGYQAPPDWVWEEEIPSCFSYCGPFVFNLPIIVAIDENKEEILPFLKGKANLDKEDVYGRTAKQMLASRQESQVSSELYTVSYSRDRKKGAGFWKQDLHKSALPSFEKVGDSRVFYCDYTDWFLRFQSILSSFKNNLIQDEFLPNFQLFLLNFGQFNANFSLKELQRLSYPKPPFAISVGYDYLRATDTWAMQIISQEYCRQTYHKDLQCVWVDSDYFWDELKRYANSRLFSSNNSHLIALKQELIKNEWKLSRPFFVEIVKPNGKNIDNAIKKTRDGDIKKFLNRLSNEEKGKISEIYLKEKLIYYFKDTFNPESKFDTPMQSIVFRGSMGEPNVTIYQLINSLGYRIDPTRAIWNLLNIYPLLFFDVSQTQKFFENFNATNYYKKYVHALEKPSLEQFQKEVITSISSREMVSTNNINFDSDICKLERLADDAKAEVKLYSGYLYHYLCRYNSNDQNSVIRMFADLEMKRNLDRFFYAVENNNIGFSVRAVQAITEVMELDLSLKEESVSFDSIVKNSYFGDSIYFRKAAILPYAMRSFVRVLQSVASDSDLIISAANQVYYELLENFEKIHESKVKIYLIRHVEEIRPETTLIFMDIHPNNVVETTQYSHDIIYLLNKMQTWESICRTLVLDVTLNALNDPEIQAVLKQAHSLIEQGLLNLVLVQSLTKFAQLGLDKRSAGCSIIFNNDNDSWREFNSKFDEIERAEMMDQLTTRFFSYFMSYHADLLKSYLEMVNKNNRHVYVETIKQLDKLETIGINRFCITTSSDPKACYVAINMHSLLFENTSGSGQLSFRRTSEEIESFSQDVLDHLVYPLCEFYGLPISARASIGFPLTSVNIVYDSLRFTIGIENDQQLNNYIQILTYVAFVLNRQREFNLFFSFTLVNNNFLLDLGREKKDCSFPFLNKEILKNSSKFIFSIFKINKNALNRYVRARVIYFNEKVKQFTAMTRNNSLRDNSFNFEFQNQGLNGSRMHVEINNGVTIFSSNSRTYNETDVCVQLDGESVRLSDSRLDIQKKRMAIACLSGCSFEGISCQNVQLIFGAFGSYISLSSFYIIKPDKLKYGPFYINQEEAFFTFDEKEVTLSIAGRSSNDFLLIKKGNTLIPFLDMSLEERKFYISEAAYEAGGYLDPRMEYMHYQPKLPRYLPRFFIQNKKLIMENDIVCVQFNRVTIYKRFIAKDKTCIEIDYWGEKDPVFSRFLSLITAILVKERNNMSFLGGYYEFRHFLFSCSFSSAGKIFEKAVACVLLNRIKLKNLLDLSLKDKHVQPKTYSFSLQGYSQLQWPSGRKGVDNINDGVLVDAVLNKLSAFFIPETTNPRLSHEQNYLTADLLSRSNIFSAAASMTASSPAQADIVRNNAVG